MSVFYYADRRVSDCEGGYSQSSMTSEVYQVYFLHFPTEMYEKGAFQHDSDIAYCLEKKLFLEDNKS